MKYMRNKRKRGASERPANDRADLDHLSLTCCANMAHENSHNLIDMLCVSASMQTYCVAKSSQDSQAKSLVRMSRMEV